MLDIIWIALLCAVYFFAGYLYAVRRMQQRAQDLLQRLINKSADKQSDEDQNDLIMIALTHEVHSGAHYFYTQEDDIFVCQGVSLEEAAHRYHELEPEYSAAFKHSTDNKMYYFIDGKVTNELPL